MFVNIEAHHMCVIATQDLADTLCRLYYHSEEILAESILGPAPSLARARFWKSGDLEIQKFGAQKIIKIEILKIHIRSAQNVGKVWVRRKKNLEGPIWGHLRVFFPWTGKIQKYRFYLTNRNNSFCVFWAPHCRRQPRQCLQSRHPGHTQSPGLVSKPFAT